MSNKVADIFEHVHECLKRFLTQHLVTRYQIFWITLYTFCSTISYHKEKKGNKQIHIRLK